MSSPTISICPWDKRGDKKLFASSEVHDKNPLNLHDVTEIATTALDGFCYKENRNYKNKFHEWFRWVQSDDPRAILWWNWVKNNPKSEIKSRDDYILKLWHSVDDDDGKNKLAKEEVKNEITDWSYYQKHFFNWFMERYHVVAARDIFTNSRFVKFIHIPLSVLTWLIAVAYLYFFRAQTCPWVFCGLSLILLFVISAAISNASKLPLPFFIQSLIPRLGVTIGAGYLFLISAGGVMAVIFENKLPQIYLIILSFLLFIIVWSYMLQLVYRRVHPSPSCGDLLKRTAHMMLMAITYSIIGLYLTTPVLFSDTFYQSCGLKGSFHPQVQHYFIIASIALAIGVALQLFWDDHPVTEPL